MKMNEGPTDRAARMVLGGVLCAGGATLFATKAFGTIPAFAMMGVGAVLLITGIVGFCPAYRLIGMSTCKTK